MFELTGLTAVVTGSSRGIGLAIAQALHSQGAAVLINGYAPGETAEALELLRAESPDRVAALAGDVSDADLAQGLVDEVIRAFGRLDHVVCNAGIDIIKPAVDYTPDEWDRILAVNLRGAFTPLGRRANGRRDRRAVRLPRVSGSRLRHRCRSPGRRRLHRDLNFCTCGSIFAEPPCKAWHLISTTYSAGPGCASAGWRWAR